MVAEALTAPFFGPLADRYGRRPVFLACVGLWGLGAIAFGLVRSVWTVILTRAFRECADAPRSSSRYERR